MKDGKVVRIKGNLWKTRITIGKSLGFFEVFALQIGCGENQYDGTDIDYVTIFRLKVLWFEIDWSIRKLDKDGW